jgi:chromosome segregation ATPase
MKQANGSKTAMIALLGAIVAVCAAGAASAAGPRPPATTYKWVDDQGVVHYSDKVPPEAVDKGATVLDRQGRAVRKIEPALTPEQIKAKEAAEQEERARMRAQEDQRRKDRALMQSYTTEAEIDEAKQRALGTIAAQIKSSQAYSAELTRRLEELKKKRASYGGNRAPANVDRDIRTADVELARQTALIKQKNEEIASVTAKYDADKARWQEIYSDDGRKSAANAAVATQTPAKGQAPGTKK